MASEIGMRNIGPVSAAWLHDVGVVTLNDLDRIGPLEAWRLVDEAYPGRASVTLLYALEAALLDIHWNDLPREVKDDLAAQVRAVRAGTRATNRSKPATGP